MVNQSDVKICIVQFDYKENKFKLFSKLCNTLINSIKKHLPDVEIDLCKIEEPNPNNYIGSKIKRSFASNSIKLKIWNDIIQNTDKHVVLLDGDTLVLDNFLEVFDEDFDIGLTFRGKTGLPFNGGVIFVKPTKESKEFFNLFLKINDEFVKNKIKHQKYRNKYAGINQSALGCLLEEYNKDNKYKIKKFPCSIYNLCDWINNDYKKAKIIHIKSNLRKNLRQYLINNNYNNMPMNHKKIIDMWNSYNSNKPQIKNDKIIPEIKYNEHIMESKDNINITEIKNFIRSSMSPNDWLELIKKFNNSTSKNKNFNEYILNIYKNILMNKGINK